MSGSDETGEVGRHPAYISIMVTLCLIAVVLNIVVIVVVIRFGHYRSSIDIFLTNLAASDIMHAGIVLPLHIKNVITRQNGFNGDNFLCKFTMVLPLMSVMPAIFTIVAMSIDRYRTIVLQKTLYRKGALIVIIIIWCLSFAISSPQIYEYNLYTKFEEEYNETYTSCGSEGIPENFETIYASLVFVCSYCMPLFVLIICYRGITVYVWKHARRLRKTGIMTTNASVTITSRNTVNNLAVHRARGMVTARKVKILQMLISVTVTFIIFWTPYFILFAMTEVTDMDDTDNFLQWPQVTGRIMTAISTISNPLLYLVFSEKVRQIFTNTYYHLKCCGESRSVTVPVSQTVPATISLNVYQLTSNYVTRRPE